MRRPAEAIRDLFFYKTLQPSRERLHQLVIEEMAIGGMWTPARASAAGRRAARPCQSTVRAKYRVWLGRRRLTRTNSEKKMRRPQCRRDVEDIWIAIVSMFSCIDG
jgi:hypothetical protein